MVTLLCRAQDMTVALSTNMLHSWNRIPLAALNGWIFKKGHDPAWADPKINTEGWTHLQRSII